MDKENSDLDQPFIKDTKTCEDGIENLVTNEEKSCPLEGKSEQINVDIKHLQQIVVDEPYDKQVLEDGKEIKVVVVDEPYDEKILEDIKEMEVVVVHEPYDEKVHKDIEKKDLKVPIVNQIDEFTYDELPFIFYNPLLVGFCELYLNSYVEEVYEDMKFDLGTWQECKQQIPKNWKIRKRKDNPRDLDFFSMGV